MRDLVIWAMLIAMLPMILRRAQDGILAWYWISFMNPHRLAYGLLFQFPIGKWVAALTLLSMLWSKKYFIPVNRLSISWVLWVGWIFITTSFALLPDLAWWQFGKIIKIMIFSFLTIMLMQQKQDFNRLLWVISLSLLFYGIKGGIFTILTGGKAHVFGPAQSFIADNNALALALLMIIPLFYYLMRTVKWIWLRYIGYLSIILSIISILGSQSRGGLITLFTLLGFLLWKKKFRFESLVLLSISIPILLGFLPDVWFERMSTIFYYESDLSALGRLNAWGFAWNLAIDRPIFGGGLEIFKPIFFEIYAPNPIDYHDSHSIYFEVLAEHGFIGLFLYGLTLINAWRMASYLQQASDETTRNIAFSIQCGLVAYLVGGAFLGMAYFDLYYAFLAMLMILSVQLGRQKTSEIIQYSTPHLHLDKAQVSEMKACSLKVYG